MKLNIIMYHYIRELKESRYPNIKGLTISLFKQQLEFFERNFHIINIDTLLDIIAGRTTPPHKKCCTFNI